MVACASSNRALRFAFCKEATLGWYKWLAGRHCRGTRKDIKKSIKIKKFILSTLHDKHLLENNFLLVSLVPLHPEP
jgi:hypothetical protein